MNAIIPFFRGRERGTRRSGLRAANRRRRIMLIEPLEGRQLLSLNPLTVESTADSGPNTLRAAITYSNANPSTTSTPNTITFAIPESDYTDQDNDSGLFYFEIDPVTPLPAITAPLIINGGSEESSELDPENNRIPLEGTPVIEISGSSMSSSVSSSASIGLTINASNVTIEQLSIYHFAGGASTSRDQAARATPSRGIGSASSPLAETRRATAPSASCWSTALQAPRSAAPPPPT